MQKVKVQRYISGKIPEYAKNLSSDEGSNEDDFIENRKIAKKHTEEDSKDHQQHEDDSEEEANTHDHRLQRLKAYSEIKPGNRRDDRRRRVHSPQRLQSSSSSSSDENEAYDEKQRTKKSFDDSEKEEVVRTRRFSICSESDSEQSDVSDSENLRRRQKLKEKFLEKQQRNEEELLKKEEERNSEASSEESSEYDEETDSEEDHEPRVKPQFVRKNDRLTIIEKEKDLIRQKQLLDQETKRQAKERRRNTLKLVEDSIKKDMDSQKKEKDPHINDVKTDDENDELEYEAWKLRELKRIKRERDEREQIVKEREEIERVRNMTEEERRKEFQSNPKEITNKSSKGKYKFLQKYYHRGAFYLDKDETVLKQDFAAPTLEDHFDKTVLPKVMQVKNFGRCGRTKYTHLIDQDTTKFDSPWSTETSTNMNFVQTKAAGMKQVFNRPSYSKSKGRKNE